MVRQARRRKEQREEGQPHHLTTTFDSDLQAGHPSSLEITTRSRPRRLWNILVGRAQETTKSAMRVAPRSQAPGFAILSISLLAVLTASSITIASAVGMVPVRHMPVTVSLSFHSKDGLDRASNISVHGLDFLTSLNSFVVLFDDDDSESAAFFCSEGSRSVAEWHAAVLRLVVCSDRDIPKDTNHKLQFQLFKNCASDECSSDGMDDLRFELTAIENDLLKTGTSMSRTDLHLLVPRFTDAHISQSTPLVTAANVIEVTFRTNVFCGENSTITIHGLRGAQTASTDHLGVESGGQLAPFARWDRVEGSLVLVVGQQGLKQNSNHILSFQIRNGDRAQASPTVMIMGTLSTADGQHILPALIVSSQRADQADKRFLGRPMTLVEPRMSGSIQQSVPLTAASNRITISVQFNVDMLQGSVIEVSGLVGSATENSNNLAIVSKGGCLESIGSWVKHCGSLRLVVASVLPADVSHSISFSLVNGEREQQASPVHGAATLKLGSQALHVPGGVLAVQRGELLGVANGLKPLHTITPRFTMSFVDQSTTYAAASSVLTLVLKTNVVLTSGSKVEVWGLEAAKGMNREVQLRGEQHWSAGWRSDVLVLELNHHGWTDVHVIQLQLTNPPVERRFPSLRVSGFVEAGEVDSVVSPAALVVPELPISASAGRRKLLSDLSAAGRSSSRVLLVVEPSFNVAAIAQSNPLVDGSNRLSITLQPNVDILQGSNISITGLLGSSRVRDESVAVDVSVDGLPSASISPRGLWVAASGTLVLQVAGGMRSNQTHVVEVEVQNGGAEQRAVDVVVSAQLEAGARDARIPATRLTVPNELRMGIENGSNPLLLVRPRFQTAMMRQSSPLAESCNTLTLTVMANTDVTRNSQLQVRGLPPVQPCEAMSSFSHTACPTSPSPPGTTSPLVQPSSTQRARHTTSGVQPSSVQSSSFLQTTVQPSLLPRTSQSSITTSPVELWTAATTPVATPSWSPADSSTHSSNHSSMVTAASASSATSTLVTVAGPSTGHSAGDNATASEQSATDAAEMTTTPVSAVASSAAIALPGISSQYGSTVMASSSAPIGQSAVSSFTSSSREASNSSGTSTPRASAAQSTANTEGNSATVPQPLTSQAGVVLQTPVAATSSASTTSKTTEDAMTAAGTLVPPSAATLALTTKAFPVNTSGTLAAESTLHETSPSPDTTVPTVAASPRPTSVNPDTVGSATTSPLPLFTSIHPSSAMAQSTRAAPLSTITDSISSSILRTTSTVRPATSASQTASQVTSSIPPPSPITAPTSYAKQGSTFSPMSTSAPLTEIHPTSSVDSIVTITTYGAPATSRQEATTGEDLSGTGTSGTATMEVRSSSAAAQDSTVGDSTSSRSASTQTTPEPSASLDTTARVAFSSRPTSSAMEFTAAFLASTPKPVQPASGNVTVTQDTFSETTAEFFTPGATVNPTSTVDTNSTFTESSSAFHTPAPTVVETSEDSRTTHVRSSPVPSTSLRDFTSLPQASTSQEASSPLASVTGREASTAAQSTRQSAASVPLTTATEQDATSSRASQSSHPSSSALYSTIIQEMSTFLESSVTQLVGSTSTSIADGASTASTSVLQTTATDPGETFVETSASMYGTNVFGTTAVNITRTPPSIAVTSSVRAADTADTSHVGSTSTLDSSAARGTSVVDASTANGSVDARTTAAAETLTTTSISTLASSTLSDTATEDRAPSSETIAGSTTPLLVAKSNGTALLGATSAMTSAETPGGATTEILATEIRATVSQVVETPDVSVNDNTTRTTVTPITVTTAAGPAASTSTTVVGNVSAPISTGLLHEPSSNTTISLTPAQQNGTSYVDLMFSTTLLSTSSVASSERVTTSTQAGDTFFRSATSTAADSEVLRESAVSSTVLLQQGTSPGTTNASETVPSDTEWSSAHLPGTSDRLHTTPMPRTTSGSPAPSFADPALSTQFSSTGAVADDFSPTSPATDTSATIKIVETVSSTRSLPSTSAPADSALPSTSESSSSDFDGLCLPAGSVPFAVRSSGGNITGGFFDIGGDAIFIVEWMSAGVASVIEFDVRNPSIASSAPSLTLDGCVESGLHDSCFESTAVVFPNKALKGVANGTNPMLIVVPTFIVASAAQRIPFVGASNTISITIRPLAAIEAGSILLLDGLQGVDWEAGVQVTGSRALTLLSYSASNATVQLLVGEQGLAASEHVFGLHLRNGVAAQGSPALFLSADIGTRPFSSRIEATRVHEAADDRFGIQDGAAALHLTVPEFVFVSVVWSASHHHVNLTIHFQTNCHITPNSTITLMGLQGITASSAIIETAEQGHAGNFNPHSAWSEEAKALTFSVRRELYAEERYHITVDLLADNGTSPEEVTVIARIETGQHDAQIISSARIELAGVNHAPFFALPGENLTILDSDAASFQYPMFATEITAGPAIIDFDQEVTFFVSVATSNLTFLSPPEIDSNGTLTFAVDVPSLLEGQHFSFTMTVLLKDDGGSANGGHDSVTKQFTVFVIGPPTCPQLVALDASQPNAVSVTWSVSRNALDAIVGLLPGRVASYTIFLYAVLGNQTILERQVVQHAHGETLGRNMSVTLGGLVPGDYYSADVVATNLLGEECKGARSRFPIQASGPIAPRPLTSLFATQVGDGAMNVTWTYTTTSDSPILFTAPEIFNVSIFTCDTDGCSSPIRSEIVSVADCSKSSCLLSLRRLAASRHLVRVYAQNSAGVSRASDFLVDIIAKPPAPTIARVLQVSNIGSDTTSSLDVRMLLLPHPLLIQRYLVSLDAANSSLILTVDASEIASFGDEKSLSFPLRWLSHLHFSLSTQVGGQALNGTAGDSISLAVKLEDAVFASDWSSPISIRVLGFPLPVNQIRAVELEDGIHLSWHAPVDTGFGDGEAPIIEYTVQYSLCSNFNALDEACEVAANVGKSDSALFSEAQLTPGHQYFFRISSTNDLGSSSFGSLVFENFRVAPSILSPTEFPVYAMAFAAGEEVQVWTDGPSSSLSLVISDFPSGLNSTHAFRGAVGNKSASVTAHALPGRIWAISFYPPSSLSCAPNLDSLGCVLPASAWSDEDPHAVASFTMVYQEYPAARVFSTFPSAGSQNGGTTLILTLVDFSGARTREGAGLINMITADSSDITVKFSCEGAFSLAHDFTIVTNGPLQRNSPFGHFAFDLSMETPPSPCSTTTSAEVHVFIGEDELPTDSPITYQFLGPRIATVAPSSGLAWRRAVQLTLRIEGLVVANTAARNVTLGGTPCSILSLNQGEAGDSVMVIQCAGIGEQVGSLPLLVQCATQTLSAQWTALPPATPALDRSSFLVDGHARQWVPKGARTEPIEVSFQVLNLARQTGWRFIGFNVSFAGSASADSVAFEQRANLIAVKATFAALNFSENQLQQLQVWTYGQDRIEISKAVDGKPIFMWEKDTSLPEVVAFAPSAGPDSGGTLLLIGITAAHELVDSRQSVRARITGTLESIDSAVLGLVPLSDWLGQGEVFQQVMQGSTQLWATMTTGNEKLASEYTQVVSELAQMAETELTSNSHALDWAALVIVRTPIDVGASNVHIGLLSQDEEVLGFNYTYVPDPLGSGALDRGSSSATGALTSGLQGGARLTLVLSNFAIVYKPDDVHVLFGATNITVETLHRSDFSRTMLACRIPPGSPGDVLVRVFPKRLPANWVTFSFTYFDDQRPEIHSLVPNKMYADSTQIVTARIFNMPGTDSVQDMAVRLQYSDTSTAAASPVSIQVLPDGSTSISFNVIPGPEGIVLVTVSAFGRSAVGSISFLHVPKGNPIVERFEPATEYCNGDSIVTLTLSNKRKLSGGVTLQVGPSVVRSAEDSRVRVISTFDRTQITFPLPHLPAHAGDVPILVWADDEPTKIGNATFHCIDLDAAEVQYYTPRAAFVESAVTMRLSVARFGSVNDSSAITTREPTGSVTVSDVSILESNSGQSLLEMTLLSQLAGQFEISVAPCDSTHCQEKNVSVVFEFWPSTPRVTNFLPSSDYIYGGRSMQIEVHNLDFEISTAKIQFGKTNVTIYANEIESRGTWYLFKVRIPMSPTTGEIHLRIFLPTLVLDFPTTFQYLQPPTPTISRIVPSSASIAASSNVLCVLQNFHSIHDLSDLAIQLVFSAGLSLDVQAATAEQTATGIEVHFLTPFGGDVREGLATIRVVHRHFPRLPAIFERFKFEDRTLPQANVRERVPMSVASQLTFYTTNMPLTADVHVSIFDQEVDVIRVTSEANGEGRVLVSLPLFESSSQETVEREALMAFGPLNDGCSSSCCSAGLHGGSVCKEKCPQLQSACVMITFYDDRLPTYELLTDSRGASVGGDVIGLRISNFAISADGDLVATFGGGESATTATLLTIDFSDETTTELRISVPPYQMGAGATSTLVSVHIEHLQRADKYVEFDFEYFAVSPGIDAVSTTSGINTGGETVFVNLVYFAYSAIDVTFDRTPLDHVHVVFSSTAKTRISLKTIATNAGDVDVVVAPRGCAQPCSHALTFSFDQVSAQKPVLDSPLPDDGPSQRIYPDTPNRIAVRFARLANVSASSVSASLSNGSVTLPVAVEDLTVEGDGRAALTILQPDGLSTGDYDITIVVENDSSRSVSFMFHIHDGLSPRLVSITPEIIPTSTIVGNQRLQLEPRVAIVVGNIELPEDVLPSDIFLDFGGVNFATVDTLQRLQTVCDYEVDCFRSQLEFVAPASESPGEVEVALQYGGATLLQFLLHYEPGCDLDRYCASPRSPIPNTWMMLESPILECSSSYCLDSASIMDLSLDAVSPVTGTAAGGTEVFISFSNLPAHERNEITVFGYDANSAAVQATQYFCEVVSLQFNPGASLTQNSGTLRVVTPSVSPDLSEVLFQVSVSVGTTRRSAAFLFEYLPVITGPVQVLHSLPKQVFASQDLDLFLELGNIAKQSAPFDATKLIFEINGTRGTASTILDSTRFSTSMTMTSAGPWPGSVVDVLVWSADAGAASGAALQVAVLPDPDPEAKKWFPTSGSSDASHIITATVDHLPLEPFDVSATLLSDGTEPVSLSTPTVRRVSEACSAAFCTSHTIEITTPDQNPRGVLSTDTATILLYFAGSSIDEMLPIPFDYIAAGTPRVVRFEPRLQELHEMPVIHFYLQDFPTHECKETASCALSAQGSIIRFGSGQAAILSLEDTSGLLHITAHAPTTGTEQVVSVTIQSSAVSDPIPVDLQFAYVAPEPLTTPIDGTMSGGSVVSLIVEGWGERVLDVDGAHELFVTFGGSPGRILGITDRIFSDILSRFTVEVVTPPSPVSGPVEGAIGLLDGTHTSTFHFQYYKAATAIALPSSATRFGHTTTADGESTVVVVDNFPVVDSPDDVHISFGTVQCFGVDAPCGVTNLVNFVDSSVQKLRLTISVPEVDFLGDAPIEIEYLGPSPIPLGMDPTKDYVIERRVVAASFSFFAPLPVVEVAQFCSICNPGHSCLLGGRCAAKALPVDAGAPLVSPEADDRVVTLVIDNMPVIHYGTKGEIVDEGASIRVEFGEAAHGEMRKIVYSDEYRTIIEVVPDNVQLPTGVQGVVEVITADSPLPITILFTFTFYDSAITLSCGRCEGPALYGTAFEVAITSFPLSLQSPPFEQVDVMFGSAQAGSVSIVSTNSTLTLLRIEPPIQECLTCVYQDGFTTVSLKVSLRQDKGKGASAPYTFWRQPGIRFARFDTFGGLIFVEFDSDTNRADMNPAETNCSLLFDANMVSHFGDHPRCMWPNNHLLRILLGIGATTVPGSRLSFLASRVRSANGLSQCEMLDTEVLGPEVPLKPVVTLEGPTTIDPCSPLQIDASAVSARQLQYTWSSDDEVLSEAISSFHGDALVLAPGTPEMQELDKLYTVTVQARDFLGAQSDAVVIRVFKSSAASPQVAFLSQVIQVTRDEGILISGRTVFSSCPIPQAPMMLSWRQVSGEPIPEQYLSSTSTHLQIPSHTLPPGSTAIVALRVSMGGDPSKTSENSVTIQVLRQGVQAHISGGNRVVTSAMHGITLDASRSRDLDRDTAGEGVTYNWDCTIKHGSVASVCLDLNGQPLQLPRSALVHIPPNALAPTVEDPYEFKVTVRSVIGQSRSTFTMPVVIVDDPIPTVSVSSRIGVLQTDASVKINENDDLVLDGSCSAENGTLLWAVSPEIDVSAVSSFPLSFDGPVFKLVGGSGILHEDVFYTFSLSCSIPGSHGNLLSGQAEILVYVNPGPRGECEACRVGTQGPGSVCETNGIAIQDQFVYQCKKWSDRSDNPLQYRFGYVVTANGEEQEFQWSGSSRFFQRFPPGQVIFWAQVRDSMGAESEVMITTLSVSEPGNANRRRLMLVSPQWDANMQLIEAEVNKRQASEVNKLVGPMAIQVAADVSLGRLSTSLAKTLRAFMLDALADAIVFAALTDLFVSETLLAAKAVAAVPAQLGVASCVDAVELVRFLVTQDTVTVMAQQIAEVALEVIGSATAGLELSRNCSSGGGVSREYFDAAASILNGLEASHVAVGQKFAASVVKGEGLHPIRTNSSTQVIAVENLRDLVDTVHFLHPPLAASPMHNVSFKMPASFLVHKPGVNANSEITLDISARDSAPISSSVIPISPLVTISLYAGREQLNVTNLTDPVRITIPLNAQDFCGQQIPLGSGSGRCLFWNGAEYSSAGCETLHFGMTSITCLCSHLTSFVAQHIPASMGVNGTASSFTTSLPTPSTETMLAATSSGGPGKTANVTSSVEPAETLQQRTTTGAGTPWEASTSRYAPEPTPLPTNFAGTETKSSSMVETQGTSSTQALSTSPPRTEPPVPTPALDTVGILNEKGEYEGLVTVTVLGAEGTNVAYDKSGNASLLSCVAQMERSITLTLTETSVITAISCDPMGKASAPVNRTFRVGQGHEVRISFVLDVDLTLLSDESIAHLRQRLRVSMAGMLDVLAEQVKIVFRDLSNRRGSRSLLATGVEATIIAADSTQASVVAAFSQSADFSDSMNLALLEVGLPVADAFEVQTLGPEDDAAGDAVTPPPTEQIDQPSEDGDGGRIRLWAIATITVSCVACVAAMALVFCCVKRRRPHEKLMDSVLRSRRLSSWKHIGQEIRFMEAPLHQAPPPSLLQPQPQPFGRESASTGVFPERGQDSLFSRVQSQRTASAPATADVDTASPPSPPRDARLLTSQPRDAITCVDSGDVEMPPPLLPRDLDHASGHSVSRGSTGLPLFPLPLDISVPSHYEATKSRYPSRAAPPSPARVRIGSVEPSPKAAPFIFGQSVAPAPRWLPDNPLLDGTPSFPPVGQRLERRLPGSRASSPPPTLPRGSPDPMLEYQIAGQARHSVSPVSAPRERRLPELPAPPPYSPPMHYTEETPPPPPTLLREAPGPTGGRPLSPRLLLREPTALPPLPPLTSRAAFDAIPHYPLDLASIPVGLEVESGSPPQPLSSDSLPEPDHGAPTFSRPDLHWTVEAKFGSSPPSQPPSAPAANGFVPSPPAYRLGDPPPYRLGNPPPYRVGDPPAYSLGDPPPYGIGEVSVDRFGFVRSQHGSAGQSSQVSSVNSVGRHARRLRSAHDAIYHANA